MRRPWSKRPRLENRVPGGKCAALRSRWTRSAATIRAMNFQKIVVPLGGIALAVVAYREWGWSGIALVAGAAMMWILLHFTRMMTILKRAADRPIGRVGSTVMLNAKLKPGVPLMHVVAMTRSLGELLSPRDTQPEVFRWTDGSQSHVTCTFVHGKLQHWQLVRPGESAAASPDSAGPAPDAP